MKKLIIFSLILVCASQTSVFAQFGYYNDALLFGRTTFGGTTRIQSIGGAQVSLGGDLSSAQSNPAGLGFYNRSEFTFTPGLNFQTSLSSFNDEKNVETFDNTFDIGNIGIVFNSKSSGDTKFKGGSFAISLNKINDFNDEVKYRGANDFSSILFSFADNAGDLNSDALGGFERAAFDTYLINPVIENNSLQFYDPVNFIGINEDDGAEIYSFPIQEETLSTSGSQYQWNFSAGGNYDDKLYFGASLGFVTLNFRQTRNYIESEFEILASNQLDDILGSVILNDRLDITGNGVNGTFGLILRPIKYLTFGASYESPTYYRMNEESSFSLTAEYLQNFSVGGEDVDAGAITASPDPSSSNYRLRTPAKLNFGSTIFVGKQGFISGDIEFVDYSSSRIRSSDFSEAADNDAIAINYKSTVNYRVGGEYRLDVFRFRAGYALQGNPYDSDLKRNIESVTFGMGYRQKKYYVDLGVVNSRSRSYYSPYVLADASEPLIRTKFKDTKVMFTVGFNF